MPSCNIIVLWIFLTNLMFIIFCHKKRLLIIQLNICKTLFSRKINIEICSRVFKIQLSDKPWKNISNEILICVGFSYWYIIWIKYNSTVSFIYYIIIQLHRRIARVRYFHIIFTLILNFSTRYTWYSLIVTHNIMHITYNYACEKMINEPPPLIYDPSRQNLICKRYIYIYNIYTYYNIVSSRRFYTTRRRVNYNGIIRCICASCPGRPEFA